MCLAGRQHKLGTEAEICLRANQVSNTTITLVVIDICIALYVSDIVVEMIKYHDSDLCGNKMLFVVSQTDTMFL